jgi:hypothetical protein
MLTRILHNNWKLCTFIRLLGLNLSRPQWQHLLNLADAVLVTDGRKTLAALRRQCVEWVDPSNIADALHRATWSAPGLRRMVGTLLLRRAVWGLPAQGPGRRLLLNLDDSLARKDPDTHHLPGVDWHYDHAAKRRQRQRLQNAWAYLLCNIVAGNWNFTFTLEPYLREKTVRRLNRQRSGQTKLKFRCKRRLAQSILEQCRPHIPADVRVYVQFDSWYASARFIKYIRRQGWHAISRIQPNRTLDGQRVEKGAWAQQHQRYVPVVIVAADGQKKQFLVRQLVGRLRDVPGPVRVLVSKRHYRDHRPVYFISTDLTLSPQTALQCYAQRWNCEVDHFYLKQRLGLGDFRLQSLEAIDRFCAVVHLAWGYVQWQVLVQAAPNPGVVIQQHRDQHAREWLIGALCMYRDCGDLNQVLSRFLPEAA